MKRNESNFGGDDEDGKNEPTPPIEPGNTKKSEQDSGSDNTGESDLRADDPRLQITFEDVVSFCPPEIPLEDFLKMFTNTSVMLGRIMKMPDGDDKDINIPDGTSIGGSMRKFAAEQGGTEKAAADLERSLGELKYAINQVENLGRFIWPLKNEKGEVTGLCIMISNGRDVMTQNVVFNNPKKPLPENSDNKDSENNSNQTPEKTIQNEEEVEPEAEKEKVFAKQTKTLTFFEQHSFFGLTKKDDSKKIENGNAANVEKSFHLFERNPEQETENQNTPVGQKLAEESYRDSVENFARNEQKFEIENSNSENPPEFPENTERFEKFNAEIFGKTGIGIALPEKNSAENLPKNIDQKSQTEKGTIPNAIDKSQILFTELKNESTENESNKTDAIEKIPEFQARTFEIKPKKFTTRISTENPPVETVASKKFSEQVDPKIEFQNPNPTFRALSRETIKEAHESEKVEKIPEKSSENRTAPIEKTKDFSPRTLERDTLPQTTEHKISELHQTLLAQINSPEIFVPTEIKAQAEKTLAQTEEILNYIKTLEALRINLDEREILTFPESRKNPTNSAAKDGSTQTRNTTRTVDISEAALRGLGIAA